MSFTVGNPPEQLEERIENYRKGQADCDQPVGKFRNTTAATFTMVHCNDTNEKAKAVAEESFVWYPKTAAASIASLAEWMEREGKAATSATTPTPASAKQRKRFGSCSTT